MPAKKSADNFKLIMQGSNWSSIDISRVSRGCSAELEDKIENILRKVQAEQGPMDFNISNANGEVRKTLAACVKRLCLRQEKVIRVREYWNSMQKVLSSGPKNGGSPAIYDHPTNSYGKSCFAGFIFLYVLLVG